MVLFIYFSDGSTIELDDNGSIVDTEVSIVNPSTSVQGTYACSVQTSCKTAIDVFVISNALQMVINPDLSISLKFTIFDTIFAFVAKFFA